MAIAGTHGKTSTSATTAHILKTGNTDVSAFIGGIMSNYGSNYIEGKGDWIVVDGYQRKKCFGVTERGNYLIKMYNKLMQVPPNRVRLWQK